MSRPTPKEALATFREKEAVDPFSASMYGNANARLIQMGREQEEAEANALTAAESRRARQRTAEQTALLQEVEDRRRRDYYGASIFERAHSMAIQAAREALEPDGDAFPDGKPPPGWAA